MNFLLVFFVLFMIIVGFIFSKIDVKINTIDIKLNDYYKKITKIDNMDINIIIYWFSFIKILKIKINKNKIFINGIKININIETFAQKRKINVWNIIKNNKNMIVYGLKNLDLELKYSTTNSYITALIYPVICTIMNNYISRVNDLIVNEICVKPYFYNVNSFKLSISCIFKFHFVELFNLKKQTA